jgi:hypothetical protein
MLFRRRPEDDQRDDWYVVLALLFPAGSIRHSATGSGRR